jgi:hypothetical protein
MLPPLKSAIIMLDPAMVSCIPDPEVQGERADTLEGLSGDDHTFLGVAGESHVVVSQS